jgi:hypothetical protein
VGISGVLRTGLGFFDPLNAAPPDTPYGDVRPVARPGEVSSVSMFHNDYVDDLGSLLYTGSFEGSRWVSTAHPNQLLTILVQALNSLLWLVRSNGACERSVF